MSYRTDHRSRTRAIAVYLTLLLVGAALGFLVRSGVITDHMLCCDRHRELQKASIKADPAPGPNDAHDRFPSNE